MVFSRVTSLALLGSAASVSALSVGSAKVVNSCSYDVYLDSVPAAGGGQEESDATLSPGQSWSQEWTALTNGNGWSIKLSQGNAMSNILQYEYTFQNDGVIWYDLSCVNGSPWDGNWDISADTDSCNPRQQAYQYSTDDAYGMQASCPQNNVITVTLCSNNGGSNSSSGESAAVPSYSAPATSEASPTPSPASSQSTDAPWIPSFGGIGNILQADVHAASGASPTPTTFATVAAVAAEPEVTQGPDGNVFTHVDIAVVTEVVTAFANSRVKRHQHHPHGHQHQA